MLKKSEDLGQPKIVRLAGSGTSLVSLYIEAVLQGFRSERSVGTSYNREVEEEVVERVELKVPLLVPNGLRADMFLHHSLDPLYVPSSCHAPRTLMLVLVKRPQAKVIAG